MKVLRPYLCLLLIFSILETPLFSEEAWAGVPCSLLIKKAFEKTGSTAKGSAKTVFQTLRPSRIPGVGGFKAVDLDLAQRIYDSNTVDEAQKEKWMEGFRYRAPRGETRFEDSMVYLRLAKPGVGEEAWELLMSSNLIVTRKRKNIDPFGLIEKFKRYKNPQLTEDEKYYLNEVSLKSEFLFLNKVITPERISDLDYHLFSLVRLAGVIGLQKGNTGKALYDFGLTLRDRLGDPTPNENASPVKAIIDTEAIMKDPRFETELAAEMTYLGYAEGLKADEPHYGNFAPLTDAVTSLVKEVKIKPLNQKRLELVFEACVQNPQLIQEINNEITPSEREGFKKLGTMGLLAAMRKERGPVAAVWEFQKLMMASAAFKGLIVSVAVYFTLRFFWKMQQAKAQLRAMEQQGDPTGSPAPQEIAQIELDQALFLLNLGKFNPFWVDGLFDDKYNPQHPEYQLSPCDPDHKIRDEYDRIKGNYTDPDNLVQRNPKFVVKTIEKIMKYAGNDPNSQCSIRFAVAWTKSTQ